MRFFLRNLRSLQHRTPLWVCRRVVTNPLRCARLFMERTPDLHAIGLRFGALRKEGGLDRVDILKMDIEEAATVAPLGPSSNSRSTP